MIFTARQLEELHKTNGHIVLPYRARLTPMAQDWVKSKRIAVGYSDATANAKPGNGLSAPAPVAATSGQYLWWCDGPCGPAKAAILAEARTASLGQIGALADPKQLPTVVKSIAAQVKLGQTEGGILMVQYGAAAMVYSNRCPSLRAVLGTCLEAVEQGVSQIAANTLVIEYSYKTLSQIRNMVARFISAK